MHEEFILTPPTKERPQINYPRVFGARPGNPILIKIPASGKKPLEYSCENLSKDLELNSETGIITGKIPQKQDIKLMISVKNELGMDTQEIVVKIGDEICLTPPMGWNSWYVNSLWVSQEKIQEIIEAFVEFDLPAHGWTYVNIDDCWQGSRDPTTNRLQSNAKFPNMKELCDFAHQNGLKMGIYSTPWVGSYAGYIGGSSPNPEHDYSEYVAPEETKKDPYQIFGNNHVYRKKIRFFGTYYGDEDAQQWADWGFDYLKYDWNPNDFEQVKKMYDSLQKTGRDIVYSLSNNANHNLVEQWHDYANLWRTTGDIRDIWISMAHIGFQQDKWAKYSKPGHWNDPDMLQIGMTATPHNAESEFRPSRLSPHEQYTQISLWALVSAPLILSCGIKQLDKFTLNLITNDEVIAINQDPLGKGADKVKSNKMRGYEIWKKTLFDGSFAVGIFNRRKYPQKIGINLNSIGIQGAYRIRDVWRQSDISENAQIFKAEIAGHGVFLVRLFPKI